MALVLEEDVDERRRAIPQRHGEEQVAQVRPQLGVYKGRAHGPEGAQVEQGHDLRGKVAPNEGAGALGTTKELLEEMVVWVGKVRLALRSVRHGLTSQGGACRAQRFAHIIA